MSGLRCPGHRRVPKLVPTWLGAGLFALFLLPAVGYAGYSVTDRWYQGYLLGLEEDDLRRDVEQLRRENVRLQAAVSDARSDASIEKVAREQLNLVKPGDRPIVLVGPPGGQAAEPSARPGPPPTPEKPAWRRLLDAIFKRPPA